MCVRLAGRRGPGGAATAQLPLDTGMPVGLDMRCHRAGQPGRRSAVPPAGSGRVHHGLMGGAFRDQPTDISAFNDSCWWLRCVVGPRSRGVRPHATATEPGPTATDGRGKSALRLPPSLQPARPQGGQGGPEPASWGSVPMPVVASAPRTARGSAAPCRVPASSIIVILTIIW
jgi:hypothetical protein